MRHEVNNVYIQTCRLGFIPLRQLHLHPSSFAVSLRHSRAVGFAVLPSQSSFSSPIPAEGEVDRRLRRRVEAVVDLLGAEAVLTDLVEEVGLPGLVGEGEGMTFFQASVVHPWLAP